MAISTRRRSSGASGATFLSNFVDALTEKKTADNNLKAAIIKAHLQNQEKLSNQKEMVDYTAASKANTPEAEFQNMMRRRMIESNPLAEMDIPTEENPEEHVSFPVERPDISSTGKVVSKPISQRDQALLFVTKYNKMVEAAKAGTGPAPAPAMQAVYQKYFNEINKIKNNKTTDGISAEDLMAPEEPAAAAGASKKNLFQQAMDAILGRGKPAGGSAGAGDAGGAGAPEAQAPKFVLGQIIETPKGKFRIIGLDDPNDPDVEAA